VFHTDIFEAARKNVSCRFASLSASKSQAGRECSRSHNGFSVETPQDAHSLVVPLGSTATKCVPSRSHLSSSTEWNVLHAADAVLRLFDGYSTISFASRSSTATRSYSRAEENRRVWETSYS